MYPTHIVISEEITEVRSKVANGEWLGFTFVPLVALL
jgi:hypothetical protein